MADKPIISTKERVGEYDAIESAKPGEPLFPLQGGDPFSIACVLLWAEQARAAGLKEPDAEKANNLLTKARQAEFVAWAFKDYQAGRVEDEGPQKSYATEDVTDRIVILSRAADRLNNALAEAYDVAAAIENLGEFPEQVATISSAVRILKRASAKIEPRRHMRKSES